MYAHATTDPRLVPVVLLLATLAIAAPQAGAYTFCLEMDGWQVVPPSGSPAVGAGVLELDEGTSELSYVIEYSGLIGTETGSHIHGPASAGQNAGILYTLPLGTPKVGVIGPLTATEIEQLHEGLWYVQVHTTEFPAGEIRGQILCGLTPVEPGTWGAIKATFQ